MRWWCPHVCMCLFAVFCHCPLFFRALFSKVVPFISGGYSIFPFSVLPHFPRFPLLVFTITQFFLVFVITMFLVLQGGSPMIDGFSIVPVSKASHFPLYFCFSDRRGGGGGEIYRFRCSFSQTPPPQQLAPSIRPTPNIRHHLTSDILLDTLRTQHATSDSKHQTLYTILLRRPGRH